MSGWDPPLRRWQAWRSDMKIPFSVNRLCTTLGPSGVYINKEVGYYLHKEGPNLGKHCVPCLLLPSTLDAQFGTPYPTSAGFDTDIGAFIESSTMLSSIGSMDPSTIYNDAAQGGVFLLGQIFVFGGFALRANSLGHLEQIDSYALGHQISF